jgi:hypothetical protein
MKDIHKASTDQKYIDPRVTLKAVVLGGGTLGPKCR